MRQCGNVENSPVFDISAFDISALRVSGEERLQ